MRAFPLILPLALAASPAMAQTTPAPAPAPAPAPVAPQTITVPPALTDPAMADRLARMMRAMSKAFLELPVGEIEAAAEGRPATRADRRRTVRSAGRADDPNFERNLQRDIANSKPMIDASMKAMATALPAMMKGLSEAGRELEKATANLPSPNYPKR
jgi:hypothetical protein